MDYYHTLKLIHLISLVFLFGWGIASAFFMFFAYLSKNPKICKISTHLVVVSDSIFTTPAFFIQPITGYLLMKHLGYSFESHWFYSVVIAYSIMGAAWFPVVWLQLRLRDISAELDSKDELPHLYHQYMMWWSLLAIPAGTAVVFLIVIMVSKPWLN